MRARQEQSSAIIDKLQRWKLSVRTLPKSALGVAIGYMDERWKGLTVFLSNADVPLDNNIAEGALRKPVLGRRNFQGSRSQRGTEVAAVFYSLLESCRKQGVDPVAYLHETAKRALLFGEKSVLLPHHFKEEQQITPTTS